MKFSVKEIFNAIVFSNLATHTCFFLIIGRKNDENSHFFFKMWLSDKTKLWWNCRKSTITVIILNIVCFFYVHSDAAIRTHNFFVLYLWQSHVKQNVFSFFQNAFLFRWTVILSFKQLFIQYISFLILIYS